ncbi:hypothetical protein [Photorhabdus africana]|uniref:hypothetical protein n=1 Tax=Photorhabdus africana TaxID=3097554 RepID=UPI002B409663|nr:hypothetical protein [Photorhabdus sp. CRI-LC]
MLTYNKALEFFGRDFNFPHTIKGLPEKLSDLRDLEIGFFKTSDEVSLSFWKAGKGETLIFIPGWSSHGAEYIYPMDFKMHRGGKGANPREHR